MPSIKISDINRSAETTKICPPGNYPLRVLAYRFGLTKDGASHKIELKLLNEKHQNQLLENLIFSLDALPRLISFLQAAGVPIPESGELEFDRNEMFQGKTFVDLLGLRAWANVFIDEYQGQKRNKVKTWLTEHEKLPRHIPDGNSETNHPEAGTPF